MEALHVRLGKAERKQPKPELRFYDGVIGLVEYAEDGTPTEKMMGINSMVEGAIFDAWHKEDEVFVIEGLDRDMNKVEFRFEPAKGYVRGLAGVLEEVRKGKETVKVRTLDRKKVLFVRKHNGVKVVK